MPSIYIRQGREKSLFHHHPWVFSGSIDHIEGTPAPGETVKIHAMDGTFLAWGAYSPISQIRIRFGVLTRLKRSMLNFSRAHQICH